MIETYRIVMGKYKDDVALVLAKLSNYITREMISDLRKLVQNMIFENFGFASRIVSME